MKRYHKPRMTAREKRERAAARAAQEGATVNIGTEYREVNADSIKVSSGPKDTIVVRGEAIVYSTPYKVRDSISEFDEIMHPGCVTDILRKGVDCRLLLNHGGLPLARTTTGTLKLNDGPKALGIEGHMDARSQLANDVAVAIERGDISAMSIGMQVGRDSWDKSQSTRQVYALSNLVDVSPVTYPCSTTTSISVLRSMGAEAAAYLSTPDVKVQRLLMRADAEYRSGKTISKKTASKLIAAHGALKDAGLGVSAATDHIANLLNVNGYSAGLPNDGAYGGFVSGQAPGSLPSAADGTGSRSYPVHDLYRSVDEILDDDAIPGTLIAQLLSAFHEEEQEMERNYLRADRKLENLLAQRQYIREGGSL